jgi:uncharacterized Fe-S cluster-containing radical SAM superfamily protein
VEAYPRSVTKYLKPFNPLQLAKTTEAIVIDADARKYTAFYCTGVYGGISTGYTVGCCLRCIYCWVSPSRDYPEKYGRFISAEDTSAQLLKNAKKRKLSRARISGGEPTLGRSHLISLLTSIRKSGLLFILETNGILLGADEGYVAALAKFNNIHIRVSIKAGNAEGFQSRTGALSEFYKLPFKAVKYLKKRKCNFHVAAMTDERFMPAEERMQMLEELSAVGYDGWIEEEVVSPYDMAVKRLKNMGIDI